ncbi:sensor histidine kinase [Cellulomonas hominis]
MTGPVPSPVALEPRSDARVVALVGGANILVVSLAAVGQWGAWAALEVRPLSDSTTGVALRVLATFLANVLPGLAVVAGAVLLGVSRWHWPRRIAALAPLSLVLAAIRLLALLWLRATAASPVFVVVEYLTGAAAGLIAVALALFYVDVRTRATAEERQRAEQEHLAASALADLEHEELRIRRQVSQQLHGSVQQHLVIIGVQLENLAAELSAVGRPDAVEELRVLAAELDTIREEQVRQLSQALFPAGVDIGLHQAVQIVLSRLPRSVTVSVTIGPLAQELNDPARPRLDVPERLLMLSSVEEGITNALKHGKATRIDLAADVEAVDAVRHLLRVTLDDDGGGPGPEPRLYGLARQRDRLLQRGGSLTLTTGPAGGGRLVVTMPFFLRDDEVSA